MLALKPDTRLALQEGVVVQAIPELDHYYVLNIENGDHFRLNHTAHWVLETIGNGVALADLMSQFAGAFEVSPKTAETDLSEVISFAIENVTAQRISFNCYHLHKESSVVYR